MHQRMPTGPFREASSLTSARRPEVPRRCRALRPEPREKPQSVKIQSSSATQPMHSPSGVHAPELSRLRHKTWRLAHCAAAARFQVDASRCKKGPDQSNEPGGRLGCHLMLRLCCRGQAKGGPTPIQKSSRSAPVIAPDSMQNAKYSSNPA